MGVVDGEEGGGRRVDIKTEWLLKGLQFKVLCETERENEPHTYTTLSLTYTPF